MGLLAARRICFLGTRGGGSFGGLDIRRGELWHVGPALPREQPWKSGMPDLASSRPYESSGGNQVDGLPPAPVLLGAGKMRP